MSRPDDPEGRESVWARAEREMREEGKRESRPVLVIWAGFLLASIPTLAYGIGRPLSEAAFWVVICCALGLAIAGLVWSWSSRRKL